MTNPEQSVDIGRERGDLKIETIRGPGDSEVSFCPERGGIVTSIKLRGKELLYSDPVTFNDLKKNVRAGIPILFPNAGPIEHPDYPGMKQHGFARTSNRWTNELPNRSDEFLTTLTADTETKKAYPYDFRLRMHGKFEQDGSFTLGQSVSNLDAKLDLPVAMGLHPYFRVPHDRKKEIKFDFPGGAVAENQSDVWMNGGTVSLDNPKLKDPDALLRVRIPNVGTVVLDVSEEYKKIWVWSLPNQDFVCIEPVMRDEGGLINEPEMVAPGDMIAARVNFRLEE